jgi:hypothetical protein
MRVNFSSTSFFKVESWAEKSGIYCRRITVFYAYFKTCLPKSIIHNLKILSDKKLNTDIGFNLKPPQALYLVLRRSDVDSPEGQKSPMIQLKLRCSTANPAEIFTIGVSRQDHSSLKFSAQKTHSKWEIIFEGGLHYPSFSFGSSLIK